ncbi:MAG TPA: cadmium resistance transporter [Candidatus Acidoferrales bacterium]|nr:cadmium resistance transporter [Candidatus Acidoferrales bacterium]
MTGLFVAFFGTNVDGFLCLAAAFAVDPPVSRIRAVSAAAFAFVLLLLASFAISLAIGRLPAGGVSWFGLVPIGIGIVRFIHGVRAAAGAATEDLSGGASVFSIVLATGADNVAVYAPLFALQSGANAVWLSAAYLAMWIAGCSALAWITPDIPKVHALKRYLEPALAIVFIALGCIIVARGGARL